MVPKKMFFTKGVGKHKERLTSFELALRDAGIASQNLVRVSSIFPPQCKLIPRKEGLTYLNPGEVVFAVIAENSTREPHRLVVSSIGVAIPSDRNTYGYLSEHHSFGETEEQAGEYAEELAAEMLATTLDVDFDPDKSWDEKKEIYRISNKIVRTSNVTQSAVGDKRGKWTTTIAAAVLISGRVGIASSGPLRPIPLRRVGFAARCKGTFSDPWQTHANTTWGLCRCA
jgi:arginine decarboxylase